MRLLRNLFLLLIFGSCVLAYTDYAFAIDYDQYLDGGGDAESKIGDIIKAIANFIIFVAIGLAVLSAAWGLVNYSGFIGNAQEATQRWKNALIVLIGGGVFWLVLRAIAEAVG